MPRLLPLVLLAALLAPAARAQAPAPTAPAVDASAAKPSIAVLPLRVEGLQLNEVQRINVQVRHRADSRGGFEVQSEADTTQLLEASQSLGLDCDVNAIECGVRLGQIADVAFVLVGRATGGLDGHVGIDASLIDVKAGGAVRRVSALLPAELGAQTEAMNAFAETLFVKPGAPAPALVSLVLQVEPAGADILVDGAPRGAAPLTEPVDALMPGDHYVVVQKKGFLTYRSRLAVNTGEAATLQITLAVDPEAMRTAPGGLEAAAPWITAGVGGLALVGGAIAAGLAGNQYLVFQDSVRALDAVDAAGQEDLDDAELATIRQSHDDAQEAADAWEGWGQATFVGGLVAAGIGLLVTAGGVAWGAIQASDVEGAEASAAPAPAR